MRVLLKLLRYSHLRSLGGAVWPDELVDLRSGLDARITSKSNAHMRMAV